MSDSVLFESWFIFIFLQEKYETLPLGFVRVVKSCLNHEEALIKQSENVSISTRHFPVYLAYLFP
jgi:hypothetical protein